MIQGRPSVVGKLGIAGILCGVMVIAAASGCGGSADPFTYKKVSGKITYDDGSLIEAPRLELKFTQVDPKPVDGNKYPRPGSCEVKVEDGTFADVTSSPQNVGGGLVPGKYEVTLLAQDEKQHVLPVAPPEYSDVKKTPLVFDTNDVPWTITVKKPTAAQKKPAGVR